MKRLFLSLIAVLFLSAAAMSQDTEQHIKDAQRQLQELINQVRNEQPQPVPPAEPQLQWNRYETKNFEIMALDDAQGKYLAQNIENIRLWLFYRWGMQPTDFPNRCKIMLVPNQQLFTKIFGKDRSSSRYDAKGSAVWIISDNPRWHTGALPSLLTEVCLGEFEAKHGVRFGVWAHRGMAVLNGNLVEMRNALIAGGDPAASKVMLTMTSDIYSKMSDANKAKFDAQCAVFCLMIRKELGKSNAKVFLDFMDESRVDSERALTILNLQGYPALDTILNSYSQHVIAQIQAGKMLDSYLMW